MMDWQAYEAGLLSVEETARAEAMLASDPKAQAELDGLKRMKRLLEKTKYVERVPLNSLKAKVRIPRVRNLRWVFTGSLAAVMAMLAWGYSTGFFAALSSRPEKPLALDSSDPRISDSFLQKYCKIEAKPFNPLPLATLQSVSCTRSWVKYVLQSQGKPFEFRISVIERKPLYSKLPDDLERKFFVREHDGIGRIGWRTEKLQFQITGLNLEQTWPIAIGFRAKTAGWTTKTE